MGRKKIVKEIKDEVIEKEEVKEVKKDLSKVKVDRDGVILE